MGREIDEELQFHLDALAEELVAAGRGADEARQEAGRRFGRIDLVRDEGRYVKGIGLADALRQDVRYGLRLFLRQPGFTAAAVLTFALGIGANTAVFTIVDAVLLKPLPYPDSGRVASIFLRSSSAAIDWSSFGAADFEALAGRQRSFEHVAAFTPGGGFTLLGADGPTQVPGSLVTARFFSVLGLSPMLGRAFERGDDQAGRPPAVVVSSRFWQEHLDGDPAAVGRSITLDERSHVVVGVMPPDFRFGRNDADLLWPILQLDPPTNRPPYYLDVLGRLKVGVSMRAATADVTRIAREVELQYPRSDYHDAAVVPFKEALVGGSRFGLLLLLGAVGLVLAIAVVNVANLQLARSAVRQREIAIRSALGAGRMRLGRQLLTESLLLGGLGGALGLVLAFGSVRMAVMLAPNVVPRMGESTVDVRALVFTAAVVVVSAALFGLAPMLRVRAATLTESLNQGGKAGVGTASTRGMHSLLVVAELSLAVVLLVGAGLLIRSLARLQSVNPGFDPDHVVTMRISLPAARYATGIQVASFYRQLVEGIEQTPGVAAAGLSLGLPPNLLQVQNPFHLDGQSYEAGKATTLAEEVPVSEGYFRALGVPLVRGRFFNDADRMPGRHSLIINAAMARRYFAGKDPVGQRLQTGDADPNSPWCTIVGVVGDVKYQGLDAADGPTLYVPFYDDDWNPWFVRSMSVVVRTPRDPASVLVSVRRQVRALDASVPVSEAHTMNQLLAQSVVSPRFRTVLLALFAAVALALAAIGVYGVLAYSVSRRTHEIGIRVALGASQADILRHVLGEGTRLALVGVAGGIAASFALSRVTSSLLFGIHSTDPLTFAAVALLLTLVAIAAAYIPARRAAAVDPLVALRSE
jgi:putative ABC transport system permease protein